MLMRLSTNLKHSFRARNVITSCPLYGLSNGQSQSFEGGFRPELLLLLFSDTNQKMGNVSAAPMMIVLPTQNIDVQSDSGCNCKGVEDVGDHFCREIANFFSTESQVGNAIGPRTYIDDRTGQSL